MATIYISGYYLYIDSDEEFLMILNLILVYLLVNIEPKIYSKYIVLEKWVKVLYVKQKKYLYGLLCSTFIFYPKLATDLNNNCFVIN